MIRIIGVEVLEPEPDLPTMPCLCCLEAKAEWVVEWEGVHRRLLQTLCTRCYDHLVETAGITDITSPKRRATAWKRILKKQQRGS